tara:strand:+ start:56 stop:319 length:264 start_codon:yes stop_codon:yes gene_type:complete
MKNTHPIELFIVACILLLETVCWIINELAGFHSEPQPSNEQLEARYKVLGKRANGISQYAPYLSFHEAQRFIKSLTKEGYDVKLIPL